MHDTLPSQNTCASGGNGQAGQSLRMVSFEAVRGTGLVRAGADAGAAHKGNEKMSKLQIAWYALTVPLRLALVFVCAVVLIAGICVMSCAGGDR